MYIHTYTYTHKQTHKHTYTHIQTHKHTYTHHVCVYVLVEIVESNQNCCLQLKHRNAVIAP